MYLLGSINSAHVKRKRRKKVRFFKTGGKRVILLKKGGKESHRGKSMMSGKKLEISFNVAYQDKMTHFCYP